MMSIFGTKRYRVQGAINSDHHIIVDVVERDIEVYGEQYAVAHQAWLNMMGTPEVAKVLRKLCKEVAGGPDAVKRKFMTTVVFREETDETD